ncbi:MAG: hypothetical protein HZRFUVUK_001245 [Candidatus Fervidibacterota bacterium]|jgi:ribosomal protein S18 acetylase RimI-like enzyme
MEQTLIWDDAHGGVNAVIELNMSNLDEMLERGIQVSLRNGKVVTVRKMRRTDGEGIYKFICGLSTHSRMMFHPHPFSRQTAEHTAAEADSPSRFSIVATYGDEIVAYACWAHRMFRFNFPVVSIAVADAFQNQGLGRQLMLILIEAAKMRKKRGLELDVYKENARAIHLYESLGFRKVGETADRRQHIMRLEFDDAQTDSKKTRRKLNFCFWLWRRS